VRKKKNQCQETVSRTNEIKPQLFFFGYGFDQLVSLAGLKQTHYKVLKTKFAGLEDTGAPEASERQLRDINGSYSPDTT